MPPRRSRGGAHARGTPIRTPTPAVADYEEEMEDGEEVRAESSQDEGEPATPAPDADGQDAPSERSSPPAIQSFPRKRRLGRPPKNRPSDWNTPEPDNDVGSDRGTPQKRGGRGRGRGPGGGFRGRPRGGPSHVTRVPVDKEGNMMDVVDDEVALPEDPEGETKVGKMGHLKGGRDYRVRTFTILGRGDRLYMLSTEPARCTGFRDSYLFFTKHQRLYKIIVDESEKHDLIAREIIPHSYKGRAIGVVTARSVFREFGARIIIGGRKIIDDYNVADARARGDIEGEIADPNDRLPPPGEPYNKNQYVAWHGASSVYHTGVPSVPMPNGKVVPGKRKINITSANWQFEHARAASRFNSVLTAKRRANVEGVYDPHTNMRMYPKIMQPTHAKWEEFSAAVVPESKFDTTPNRRLANGVTEMTNGMSEVNLDHTASTGPQASSIFSAVPPVISRNFLITDACFTSASLAGLGVPGPDGDYHDIGPNGLPDVSADMLAELPADCREAFEKAKRIEGEWKTSWQTETVDGIRGKLRIGFLGYPV